MKHEKQSVNIRLIILKINTDKELIDNWLFNFVLVSNPFLVQVQHHFIGCLQTCNVV